MAAIAGSIERLPSPEPISQPKGTMARIPQGKMEAIGGCGFYTTSGNVYVKAKLTQEEQQKFEDLYKKLTSKDASHHQATIDLKRGYLHKDGVPIYHLDTDPNSEEWKTLVELRTLYYHGAGCSEFSWPEFRAGERAAIKDPLPFEMRKPGQPLHNLSFDVFEKATTPEQRREGCTAAWLQQGFISLLDKESEKVSHLKTMQAQSRRRGLAAAREQYANLDQLVLGFWIVNPPPATGTANTLTQYKNLARQSLLSQKAAKGLEPQIEELSKELALLACRTRSDYDRGCILFETTQRKTTPEFLIMMIVEELRKQTPTADILKRINYRMDTFFEDVSPEDKANLQKGFAAMIEEARQRVQDPALQDANTPPDAFIRRKEHLDIGKKYEGLSKTYEDLASHFRPQKADGSPTGHDGAIWADLDNLRERFKLLPLKSSDDTLTDEQYCEISASLSSITKDLQSVSSRLQAGLAGPVAQETRQGLRDLASLIDAQTKLAAYLERKASWRITKWIKSPLTLDDI